MRAFIFTLACLALFSTSNLKAQNAASGKKKSKIGFEVELSSILRRSSATSVIRYFTDNEFDHRPSYSTGRRYLKNDATPFGFGLGLFYRLDGKQNLGVAYNFIGSSEVTGVDKQWGERKAHFFGNGYTQYNYGPVANWAGNQHNFSLYYERLFGKKQGGLIRLSALFVQYEQQFELQEEIWHQERGFTPGLALKLGKRVGKHQRGVFAINYSLTAPVPIPAYTSTYEDTYPNSPTATPQDFLITILSLGLLAPHHGTMTKEFTTSFPESNMNLGTLEFSWALRIGGR